MRLHYYQPWTYDWTRGSYSHFVFPSVSPGRGWWVLHCKQSQPVLGAHFSKSFMFNLPLNPLELMMVRHSNKGAVPPNSGWIFSYESLGKGKTKPEGNSLLTFPVPVSSSSPWQALSPLTRTSHTLFFPGKEKLLTENVTSHSSVNAISVLSSQGEAEQRGHTWFLTASTRHHFAAFHSRFSVQAKRKSWTTRPGF